MQKLFSFRQKLGGAFALLLLLILLHGVIGWFTLQIYENAFQESYNVEQIVKLTLRARMNEKNYVLTGERHFAITVQQELQEAQNMVLKIIEHSSLEKSLLLDMSNSLEQYLNTFSQYVIYEDQHRALNSEGNRLDEEFSKAVSDLQEIDQYITNEMISPMYWFLARNNKEHQNNEKERLSAEQARQKILSILEHSRQDPSHTKAKLAVHRLSIIVDDSIQLLDKIKILEQHQHLNESKMKTATEDVQILGRIAAKNQQEKVQQQRIFITNFMMVIFCLSTGIALWATFYLSNRLTRPLKDLVAVTSSLGQGHFHERIEIEGDDEFHNLLLSINQMAQNISNLTSNMEELVEERTKALEMEIIRFQKLFENNPEGILIFDEDMRVLDANNAFTLIFGYTLTEIYDQKIQDFLLPHGEPPVLSMSPREESIRRCKNGNLIPVSIVRYSFQQLGGKNLYYVIYTDISERKKTEERLNFLSFHDSLTNLKNRTYFELEMNRLQNSQESCGIIVCDVDGLKCVNDTFGHGAGDQLLKDAAQLLTGVAGKRALARVGGDEFVIFLPNSLEDETYTMSANINTQLNALKSDTLYPLKMSVGYAYRENATINMEELFSLADKMMYSIKKNHRKQ